MKQFATILLVLCLGRCVFAMASTDIIDGPIEASTAASYGFPDNALPLINDWHRFWAWHPWFSELPNDSYYFGYSTASLRDLNELLGYFGEIKADGLVIELDPDDKDGALARHFEKSKDKPDAGPITLRLSSQSDLDRWFDQLGEKGKKKFKVADRPKASPPTMRIFAGHKLIDLEKLQIPKNVTVKADISDWQRKDKSLATTIERIEKFIAERSPTTAPSAAGK